MRKDKVQKMVGAVVSRLPVSDETNIVALKLLERINQEKTFTSFEYQSESNLMIYMKGCIRNAMIDTIKQDNELTSLTEDIMNVKSCDGWHPYNQSQDDNHLLDDIIYPKLSDKEKDLFDMVYVQGLKHYEIAKTLDITSATITYHIKRLNSKLAKLPIRSTFNPMVNQSVNPDKGFIWNPEKDSERYIVNLSSLKRYRRSNDQKEIDRYIKSSNQILGRHQKIVGKTSIPATLKKHNPVTSPKMDYSNLTFKKYGYNPTTQKYHWFKTSERSGAYTYVFKPTIKLDTSTKQSAMTNKLSCQFINHKTKLQRIITKQIQSHNPLRIAVARRLQDYIETYLT